MATAMPVLQLDPQELIFRGVRLTQVRTRHYRLVGVFILIPNTHI